MEGEQTLLRVYLRNTDKHGWFSAPVAEQLVQRARSQGLAGATVLRGILGLDAAGRLLPSGSWSLVEQLPIIVEFVDSARAIGHFLSFVDELLIEGMATLERGHVLLYRQKQSALRTELQRQVPEPIRPLSTLPTEEEFPVMKMSEEGQLLRVFIGESDLW